LEGGLDEEESFAVAAALAKIRVKTPVDLCFVDEEDVAAVAVEAKLSKVGAKKLAQVIKGQAPSPKPSDEAEELSPVAAQLINDFKMNAKVKA